MSAGTRRARIEEADELELASFGRDGTPSNPGTMWDVRRLGGIRSISRC